jgi:hypothetical protein
MFSDYVSMNLTHTQTFSAWTRHFSRSLFKLWKWSIGAIASPALVTAQSGLQRRQITSLDMKMNIPVGVRKGGASDVAQTL